MRQFSISTLSINQIAFTMS